MSSSKARSTKYMKAIATYEQADIAEAVGVLDDEQQRTLAILMKKIHNKLEGDEGRSSEMKRNEVRNPNSH
jgi:hypothetical protein